MASSENAFKEAYILYPLSPEANFRLVQEVYLRIGKFSDAQNLISDFCEMDPGNDRAKAFAGNINNIVRSSKKISTLRRRLEKSQILLSTSS